MKFFAVLLLAGAIAVVLWQKGVFTPPAPPAAPPPPPPAILNEPAPVINEAELQKVLKSATDPEPTVRWEAVVFLDKVKAPQAMPLIQEMLLHDQEPTLKIKLIGLLSDRRGPEVMSSLLGATHDQEADVRLAALRALEKIGDFSIASQIADGPIRDQDENVRLQAMKTLNSLQDRKQKEIEEARARYEADKAAAAAAAAAQKK
ncbi:MAG: HEAT repeat domain-containing protein [Elusimicrobiota bacterium]